jgi:hypothetical protein
MPVLHDVDDGGMRRVFYIGWYIRDAQRHAMVPRLTDAQRETLDIIETIPMTPRSTSTWTSSRETSSCSTTQRSSTAARPTRMWRTRPSAGTLLRLWLSAAHYFASVEGILRAGGARS